MGASTHRELVNSTLPSVCIIGAGNVATHLAHALDSATKIVQVYSYGIENALKLSESLISKPIAINRLEEITWDADYYIVSVKDDVIESIAKNTPDCDGVWAHTSGSIPMSVFKPYKKRYGVFYPLQTFSKVVEIDVTNVPFFIEGNDENVYDSLSYLASLISKTICPADSDRRKALHVAAVFACNFVNYMWKQADDLLRQQGLDITYLKPLLVETLRKLDSCSPKDAQTGPARRGDKTIIENHITSLSPRQAEIYRFLSDCILDEYGYKSTSEL